MTETNQCSVLVHVPAMSGPTPRPAALNLWPGEQVMFGRGSASWRVDIRLDRPGISRLAGRVEAMDGYWMLTNLASTANATYVVHNDQGRGEHFTIRPGDRLPVPFRESRIELLDAESNVFGFKVFVLRRAAAAIPVSTATVGRTGSPVRPINETTKHFLVLVALCEPRLVHGSAAVPTIPDLLRRVQDTRTGCDIRTHSAVNFQIEYLVDRLGLRDSDGLEDRRAGLINRALWFGIVREEHLGLLTSNA
ncbi:FHA domain-containing protein [Nocardia aurea]|uniref:FHA domain-containing protein n=1 Tax=Nocardia aurea TaxID=2144174 RepID=UPI0033AA9FEB